MLYAVQVTEETPFARSVDETAVLIDECVASMNEVLSAYEGISDTLSADAAAGRLRSLHARMQAAVDKVNSIGEADAATQNLFMTKLLPMLFVNAARTQAAFERIRQNNYYGSEKLRHFMEDVLEAQG
ncbi:MAG: hypothetical protein IKV13_02840 [Akkermansia sp.]|nr:hypothetical protein [Akkermansia sp.]